MHYSFASTLASSDCLAVGIFQDQVLSEHTLLSPDQAAQIAAILKIHPEIGQLKKLAVEHLLPGFAAKVVILFGLGAQEKYTRTAVRKALSVVGQALTKLDVSNVQIVLPKVSECPDDLLLRQAVISLEDAHISRDALKTKPAPVYWPEQVCFVGPFTQAEKALAEGQAIAAGIHFTKTLANLPANHCTPSKLADYALGLTKDQPKLTAEIYDEKAIAALKMGCLLAVGKGSVEPPRLIVVHYQGGAKDQAPIVLLGKGITFDSGGISIKGRQNMNEMKYDMSGGAAVLGTLKAANTLQLPINLIGVIVSAENLPSGSADKPGDVVTSMSGKTVEILDTDAEGRLVLSDGLTFVERFKPKAVIDLATLTGAIVISLGKEASGLMGNNEALAKQILAAGSESGDRAWQLPLWEEYQELIDTPFADVANLGNGDAGSITAACFLARFAEQYPWAHLDIAGTAYVGGSHMNRAATGRPVSLLMHYLLSQK